MLFNDIKMQYVCSPLHVPATVHAPAAFRMRALTLVLFLCLTNTCHPPTQVPTGLATRCPLLCCCCPPAHYPTSSAPSNSLLPIHTGPSWSRHPLSAAVLLLPACAPHIISSSMAALTAACTSSKGGAAAHASLQQQQQQQQKRQPPLHAAAQSSPMHLWLQLQPFFVFALLQVRAGGVSGVYVGDGSGAGRWAWM